MRKILMAVFLCLASQTVSAQYAKTYPRSILPLENAVCRVRAGDGSAGSGVLVQPSINGDRRAFVMTAYHVVRDGASGITVTWDGEKHHKAVIAAARPSCDAVVLSVVDVPDHVPRTEIAKAEVQVGELAYAFGFGGLDSNTLRSSGGPVTGLTLNEHDDGVWFSVYAQTLSGDSGGPVFVVRDGRPYLIGIAWGCSVRDGHWSVSASRLCVARRLFGLEQAAAHPAGVSRESSVVRTAPVQSAPVYSPIVYSAGSS